MQTALHIAAVVADAKRALIGAELYACEFYRKERAAYMYFRREKTKSVFALSYHPQTHGAFVLPLSAIPPRGAEKPFPFFQQAAGAKVTSVAQIAGDRLIHIDVQVGSARMAVIVEAIASQSNLWLLDAENRKLATLRPREYAPGDTYAAPGESRYLTIESLSIDTLRKALALHHSLPLVVALRKTVAGLDDTLTRETALRSELDAPTIVDSLNDKNFSRVFQALQELLEQFRQSNAGFVYAGTPTPGAYPFRLRSAEEKPRVFGSYSEAAIFAAHAKADIQKDESDTVRLRKALATTVSKLDKQVNRLEAEYREAEQYERHKQLADIINANVARIKKGASSLTAPDLYNEDESVTITLDPRLTPARNADAYYRKYQNGREAVELLKRRIEVASRELIAAKLALQELERDPEVYRVSHNADLADLISQSLKFTANSKTPAPRLPYKVYALSTGVRVFVGRDGSDNDDTTFHHIKPYELWFHASQCPGSHVGMKFPDKSFAPSKKEIEETAAIAAWFSKARHNKTAPVNYTERKYVRKPRNAKSGLVIIEREKTVMVAPRQPSPMRESAGGSKTSEESHDN